MGSGQARAAALCAVAAAVIVTLAGCTSGSSASGGESLTAAAGTAVGEAAPDLFDGQAPAPTAGSVTDTAGASTAGAGNAEDSAGSSKGGGVATRQLATVPVDGSKVIKVANLSVRLVVAPVPATADPAADAGANATARSAAITTASASVRGIAAAAGGFQASADGGGSQLSISLRVPADQYDAAVDKLVALGELTNRTETSQDVTADLVDVASRVDSMTASVARVRALLGQATNIADVISIESELSVREADLESLQQQQAALQGRVAMSTISLALTAETGQPRASVPAEDESGFLAGMRGGWAALVAFVGWSGGILGAVLPFLPLLLLVGALLWWLARRVRRPGRRAAAGGEPGAEQESAGEPVGVGSG